GDLVLPDADGLDDDHREAGRLEDEHRLTGGPGHPPEVPAAGARPDEGTRPGGELGHPGAVPEDRAAGAPRARVDGDHPDRLAGVDEPGAEGVDEGRLPRPGDAADADPDRRPGVRGQTGEQVTG